MVVHFLGLCVTCGCRAYDNLGDEKGVTFIVMATPDDIKANAEYIRLADECVKVPGD